MKTQARFPNLFQWLGLALALILSFAQGFNSPASAQGAPVFYDVDKAQEQGRPVTEIVRRLNELYGGSADYNLILDGKQLFRRKAVPVALHVTGDWGEYKVTCALDLGLTQRALTDTTFHLEIRSPSGVITAGFVYDGQTAPRPITTYIELPREGSDATYAGGFPLLGPECDLNSITEPEQAEHPEFERLNQANLDCTDALIALLPALASNPPIPPECLRRNALLVALGQKLEFDQNKLDMLQKCTLDAASSIISTTEPSDDCASFLRSYSDTLERNFGLCDLEQTPDAKLTVLSPHPESFAARYRFRFKRVDCKEMNVTAYINTDPPEHFKLVKVLPEASECLLVDYMRPTFLLGFDANLNGGNLQDQIRLGRLQGPSLASIPVTIEQIDDRILHITPVQRLDPFTDYQLSVRTGPQGLRSTEGAELLIGQQARDVPPVTLPITTPDFSPVTWFTTMPYSDLDTEEGPFRFLGSVYQVSKNAPLVQNRPTAARIKWQWEPDQKGLSGQSPKFCGDFDVRDADTDIPLFDTKKQIILPHKDYNEDDRLHARNSVNLFNWRPTKNVRRLSYEMRPSLYYLAPDSPQEPPMRRAVSDVAVEQKAPLHLRIKYAYLQVADFEEPPSVETQDLMAQHMRAARRYTWQTGPFGKVSVQNLGATTARGLGLSVPDDLIEEFDSFAENAAQAFAMQHCKTQSEVCTLFVPPVIRNHRDVTTPQTGRGIFLSAAILGMTSKFTESPDKTYAELIRWRGNGADVAHEIGHSFGLHHDPRRVTGNYDFMSYEENGGRFPGIDGVRMHPSGKSGVFKSSSYGNPDTPRLLAPLMFPGVLPSGATHPKSEHYEIWQINAYTKAPFFGQRYPKYPGTKKNFLPTFTNRFTYTEQKSSLISSNLTIFDEDGADVRDHITRFFGFGPEGAEPDVPGLLVSVTPELGEHAPNTSPRLQVLQMPRLITAPALAQEPHAQGDLTLAGFAGDIAVAEMTFPLTENPAQLFLPLTQDRAQDLTHLQIRDKQGSVLWHHDVAAPPIVVNERFESDGKTGVLRWDTTESDLPVIIRFHPDAGTPRSVGTSSNTGRFDFDLASLGVTGSGAFHLLFDNGIAPIKAIVPARLQTSFAPLVVETVGHALRPELAVTFNRGLAQTLPTFELLQGDTPLETDLVLAVTDDTLYVTPSTDLAPCTNYTLRAARPLTDFAGTPMQPPPSWPLRTGNTAGDCPDAIVPASLTRTRDGTVETSVGEVQFDAKTQTVTLTFPRVTLVLKAPDWSEGRNGLIGFSRGNSRRDIILAYAPETAPQSGMLDITRQAGKKKVRYSATLRGVQIEGEFSLGMP